MRYKCLGEIRTVSMVRMASTLRVLSGNLSSLLVRPVFCFMFSQLFFSRFMIPFWTRSRMRCFRYAAIFLGPSGKRSFVFLS